MMSKKWLNKWVWFRYQRSIAYRIAVVEAQKRWEKQNTPPKIIWRAYGTASPSPWDK